MGTLRVTDDNSSPRSFSYLLLPFFTSSPDTITSTRLDDQLSGFWRHLFATTPSPPTTFLPRRDAESTLPPALLPFPICASAPHSYLKTTMGAQRPGREPRKRSERPRRGGGKKHRRWAGRSAGDGAVTGAAAGHGTSNVASSCLGRPSFSLKAEIAKVPSKLGWRSEGLMVIRRVRSKVVTGSVARICSAMSDASFEVMFNHVPLEVLLNDGKQRPTDMPEGGRFMRKFGGRAPAPLANLPAGDFDDWISLHKVADDMLYVINLGFGSGPQTREHIIEGGDIDGQREFPSGGPAGDVSRAVGEDVVKTRPHCGGPFAGGGPPGLNASTGGGQSSGKEDGDADALGAGGPACGGGAAHGSARLRGGTPDAEDTDVIKGRSYYMIGPTVLRSKGACKEQLMHVDHARPREMHGTDTPKLSMLMALEDGTKVDTFPGSHRHLPDASGGCLTQPIACRTVVLNAGDILIFRQDLVHRGAASSGLCHRWHWYADIGREVTKRLTFYVLPFGTKTAIDKPRALRRSSRK